MTRHDRWGNRPLHNIFEVVLMMMVLPATVPLFFSAPPPNTLAALLDPHLLKAWAVMLTAGSGLTLLGLFWPGRVTTSLVVELTGLILAGGAVCIYIWGALEGASSAARVPLAIVLAFGIACLLRAIQVRREVNGIFTGAKRAERSE